MMALLLSLQLVKFVKPDYLTSLLPNFLSLSLHRDLHPLVGNECDWIQLSNRQCSRP